MFVVTRCNAIGSKHGCASFLFMRVGMCVHVDPIIGVYLGFIVFFFSVGDSDVFWYVKSFLPRRGVIVGLWILSK